MVVPRFIGAQAKHEVNRILGPHKCGHYEHERPGRVDRPRADTIRQYARPDGPGLNLETTHHMAELFILIPGRTSVQGTTLNEGKYTDGYVVETGTLKMAPADMQRLSLSNGDHVRMWTDRRCAGSWLKRRGTRPSGLLFISYGDISSRLMGGETHGSGMPDSKGLDVWVERV